MRIVLNGRVLDTQESTLVATNHRPDLSNPHSGNLVVYGLWQTVRGEFFLYKMDTWYPNMDEVALLSKQEARSWYKKLPYRLVKSEELEREVKQL